MSSYKSDLPINNSTSYNQMVAFFDNRFQQKLEFAADDYNAVVAFFEKRDFGSVSAKVLAQVILSEAKKEKIPVFKILDSFAKYNKIQLSNIIHIAIFYKQNVLFKRKHNLFNVDTITKYLSKYKNNKNLTDRGDFFESKSTYPKEVFEQNVEEVNNVLK